MRVITGAGDTQTPILAEAMDQVVFSPHWNVPANILEAEVLPKIRKDPGYLARRNMEMVRSGSGDVSVRQRPGPSNALGLVKFQFPNPFNVYLHDTPGDALFAQARRALSHGCVRLEKPEELARFVLRGSGWNDAAIARAMRSGREQFVTLPAPAPLRIAYFTTWVDDDGAVVLPPRLPPRVAQAMLFRSVRFDVLWPSAARSAGAGVWRTVKRLRREHACGWYLLRLLHRPVVGWVKGRREAAEETRAADRGHDVGHAAAVGRLRGGERCHPRTGMTVRPRCLLIPKAKRCTGDCVCALTRGPRQGASGRAQERGPHDREQGG